MYVVRNLPIIAVRKESIAHALAIRKEAVRMIDEQYSSLIAYKSAMSQAISLVNEIDLAVHFIGNSAVALVV